MTVAPEISILLPTRGRPKLFLESVASLLDTASHPDVIELVVRRDVDDTSDYPVPRHIRFVQFLDSEPLGYAGLHEYYNQCADHARGRWFVIWNDDCVMRTKGWDDHIRALVPEEHPIALFHGHFPTVHWSWHEAAGRLSASPHADTYLCHVAEELIQGGHMTRPGGGDAWDVLHRCDELLDEGSERRKAEILGPDGTSARFFRPDMRAKILADAEQIAIEIFGAKANPARPGDDQ